MFPESFNYFNKFSLYILQTKVKEYFCPGPGCSNQGKDNSGLLPNMYSDMKVEKQIQSNSFCQEFDDRMLSKVKRKLSKEILLNVGERNPD